MGAESTDESLRSQLTELAAVVAQLRAELDAHRRALRRELRTERITLAAADGFPRVELVATTDHGRVTVHGRTPSPEPTCVELFANDVGATAHVGVAITETGTVVVSAEVVEGSGSTFWPG